MQAELARRAETSLSTFIKCAWRVLEPSTHYIGNWHIDAICEHLEAVTSGQIRNLLINMPPRHMKPVACTEMVLEKSKGRIPLAEVCVGDAVLTHEGRFRNVEAVHEQGELPILEIATWHGRKLRVAYDHPILTARGWIQAQHLTTEDVVAVVHPQQDCGSNAITHEEARLLGYLIGDGHVKYGATSFTNQDPEAVDDCIACASSLGFASRVGKRSGKNATTNIVYLKECVRPRCPNHPHKSGSFVTPYCSACRQKFAKARCGHKPKQELSYARLDKVDTCDCGRKKDRRSKKCYFCNGNTLVNEGWRAEPVQGNTGSVRRWRRTHELDGKCSYDKRVPHSILSGDCDLISEFLAAYWACDGEVKYRADSKSADGCVRSIIRISCTTVSEGLARDILHLLTRLGINAHLRQKVVQLKTKRQGEKYTSWMVTAGTQDDAAKFMEVVGRRMRHEKRNRTPDLSRCSFDAVRNPDGIVSITPLSEPQPCRCLTVEEDHSFTANDIAVKNSIAVGVCWPVWEWLRFPHRRWLFSSYALSLSIRDSLKCRRLIESPWFQARWGNRFIITGDQNAKMRFDNDKTGYRIATSVGGAATGEGGDRVVVDDAHNVQEKESDLIRESTLVWWDETMSTRLNNPKTDCKVIVMQRVHEKDLSGHVLAQGGYTHLCLPAEFDPAKRCITSVGEGEWRDPREEPGELLWPERIGDKEITDFKLRLGPTGYAGQFQQRPTPAGGGRFKQAWFRYYAIKDGKYVLYGPDGGVAKVWRDSECKRFAVMDPAGAEKEQNNKPCFTVIQTWGLSPEGDMLLRTQYREQAGTPETADMAAKMVRAEECAYIGIEKDGIGLGVVQNVKRKGIAVRAIKARGSKEARSETAEIRMAAGMIYFPQGAHFLPELENEILLFPNGEYLDQVDALSHAAIAVNKEMGPPVTVEDQKRVVEDEHQAEDMVVAESQEQRREAAVVMSSDDDFGWTDIS